MFALNILVTLGMLFFGVLLFVRFKNDSYNFFPHEDGKEHEHLKEQNNRNNCFPDFSSSVFLRL